jgi:hypothetical protein
MSARSILIALLMLAGSVALIELLSSVLDVMATRR